MNREIEFENFDCFILFLSCFDSRFGECKVQVTVSDENDNSPKFTNLPNDTSVFEGTAASSVFFTVRVRINMVTRRQGRWCSVEYPVAEPLGRRSRGPDPITPLSNLYLILKKSRVKN